MKTITLEVENEGQEELIRIYHSFVMEMEQLALTAPMEEVIDQCEEVAVRKGADINRETLQRAVQRRIDAAEKKGRRCERARAAGHGKTAGKISGDC